MLKRIAYKIIPRLALGLCLLALAPCLWPGSAALAQNPPLDEPRYCTWLFWSKDPALIKLALERLAQGDPFMIVARETARKHSKNSQANADCMRASGMDQAVLAVVKDLKIGEISRPFDLGGGTALVMRTTDQHRRKAQEYYSKGRYSQAERELLRDLRLHPASSAAWHMLALTRTAQGNYKQALAALDKALVWSPRNSAMLNDKASALANLGRSKQAVSIFEKALKLDPKNPTIMSNLAWALTLIRKNPKRAEALAWKACDEAPQEARFWHTLGKVQAAQGEHGKAVVSFRQTLMLEPKNKIASLDLVKSIKALDPKVLARLSQKTPPPEPKTALKPVPKPEPQKIEQGIGKGMKRAPDLAGPAIALPSHWPALSKPEAKTAAKPEAETKTAAKQKSVPETQAKAKPEKARPAQIQAKAQAKAPSEAPSKIRGRIVSLPMPKFPEPPSAAPVQAKDDETAPQKDKAAPKPAPANIEKEAAKPSDKPKVAEAKPAPPEIKPEKAKALAKDEPAEPEAPSPRTAEKPKPGKDLAKKSEAQPAKPKAQPKPGKPKAADPKLNNGKAEVEKAKVKPVEKAEAKAPRKDPQPEPKSQEAVKEKAGDPKPKPGMVADQKAAAGPAKPKPAPKTDKPNTAEAKPKPVKADAKTAPEPSPKAAIDKPHYLIQVASYRPESLAQKELRAWQRRKMSGHIEKWQDKRGRTWHRVLLGPFAAAKDAEIKARALKAKRLVRDYYVVKRPAD